MPKTPEGLIQSKITKHLRKNKIQYNKLMSLSFAGWPDLITVKDSVCYFFEVKQPGRGATKLQRSVIDRLNSGKQPIAFVVHSLEEFLQIWETL